MQKKNKSTRKDKPFLKMYVQDFMTDEKLSQCSAGANGVYIWTLLLMTKSEIKGTILLKQKWKQNVKQKISKTQAKRQAKNNNLLQLCLALAKQLGRNMPFETDTINEGLQELLQEEVLHIEGETLIQKRMYRDGQISIKRSISGSEGGKQRIKNMHSEVEVSESDLPDNLLKQNVKQSAGKSLTSIGNNYNGNNTMIMVQEKSTLSNIPTPVLKYYNMTLEHLHKTSSHNSIITAETFDLWKQFVRLINDDEHEFYNEIFTAKFVFPKDFVKLLAKGFTPDIWAQVISKILSVGLNKSHNLFFRIPDAMGWRSTDQKNPGRSDQAAKIVGNNDSDYSKNKF